jgi:hypothetical protein
MCWFGCDELNVTVVDMMLVVAPNVVDVTEIL